MAKSRFRSTKGYTQALKDRTEQSGSGGYVNIFKSDLNLPMFKEPKEGDVGIDIIPYLATENNPQYPTDAQVYKLELWVHQMVGPDKGNYICLRNFNEECPLCEARWKELAEESPREEVTRMLKGSHRVIYNVVVAGEEDKGVQIWTASTYLSENPFKDHARNRKTGERIPYACPDTGRTIWFTCKGTGLSKEFAGISMEERPEPISDEILDQAFELEEIIDIPSAETLQKIAKVVLGGGTGKIDDDEPDPPPRRARPSTDTPHPRRKTAVREEPEDDEPEEYDDEPEDEAPPPRRRASTSRTRRVKETEEYDEPEDEEPEDDEPEDEPEPERKPIRRRKNTASTDEETIERKPRRRLNR